MKDLSKTTYDFLKAAFQEDLGRGDVTSRLLIPRLARGVAVVVARGRGIFCGCEAARAVFKFSDPSLALLWKIHDGQSYASGQKLFEVKGNIQAVLAAERTALNFLGRLSGIATLTREFVKRVSQYGVEILDTRKTTPLWRKLEKYAVRTGGGKNHRMGLYDEIFIKENHRPFADFRRLQDQKGRFEIEVRNLKELRQALAWFPRVILFDNFSPSSLRRAVQEVRREKGRRIILEASGGVTPSTEVPKYA